MAGRGSDLELPLTVDAFTLDRRIGAGAMGEVYHAVEGISGRQVAFKVMAGHLMGNARAEARFRREISAMGQLRHAGIPAFAGWGEMAGGRPYLAMDYVAGHQLDAFITPGRGLPEDLSLWVAMRLADVIGHCHRECGMIHRDLKPGNVMVDLVGLPGLCERSQLKILDFGLATYLDFGDFEDFREVGLGYAAGGTVVGEVMGTPAYMSPEQIRGEALTFQSDIYAIGAILVHLLTGRLPYEGSSAGVVMAKHLDAPVPDPSQSAAVRPATVSVVQRAMAKTPQSRFRSYQQFLAALQAARYANGQATKRIARPEILPPGEPVEQQTTHRTEPMPATGESGPPAPAVPLPVGSSGTPAWKRPGEPPTTSTWRRPTEGPVLPTTSSWRRPVKTPPPSSPSSKAFPALDASGNEVVRDPPSPATSSGFPALDPSGNETPDAAASSPASSTSSWRRPVRTPPPADEDVHEPTAAPPSDRATPGEQPVHQPPTTSRWRRPIRTPPPDGGSAGP